MIRSCILDVVLPIKNIMEWGQLSEDIRKHIIGEAWMNLETETIGITFMDGKHLELSFDFFRPNVKRDGKYHCTTSPEFTSLALIDDGYALGIGPLKTPDMCKFEISGRRLRMELNEEA